jgi:hypothetical protein
VIEGEKMPRRKPFKKCILKEMKSGLTRKDAIKKCEKKISPKKIKK